VYEKLPDWNSSVPVGWAKEGNADPFPDNASGLLQMDASGNYPISDVNWGIIAEHSHSLDNVFEGVDGRPPWTSFTDGDDQPFDGQAIRFAFNQMVACDAQGVPSIKLGKYPGFGGGASQVIPLTANGNATLSPPGAGSPIPALGDANQGIVWEGLSIDPASPVVSSGELQAETMAPWIAVYEGKADSNPPFSGDNCCWAFCNVDPTQSPPPGTSGTQVPEVPGLNFFYDPNGSNANWNAGGYRVIIPPGLYSPAAYCAKFNEIQSLLVPSGAATDIVMSFVSADYSSELKDQVPRIQLDVGQGSGNCSNCTQWLYTSHYSQYGAGTCGEPVCGNVGNLALSTAYSYFTQTAANSTNVDSQGEVGVTTWPQATGGRPTSWNPIFATIPFQSLKLKKGSATRINISTSGMAIQQTGSAGIAEGLLNVWHQHTFSPDYDDSWESSQFPWESCHMVARARSGAVAPDNIDLIFNQVGGPSDPGGEAAAAWLQYAGPDALSDTSGPSGMAGGNQNPGEERAGDAQSLYAQPYWFIIYMGDGYEWASAA